MRTPVAKYMSKFNANKTHTSKKDYCRFRVDICEELDTLEADILDKETCKQYGLLWYDIPEDGMPIKLRGK